MLTTVQDLGRWGFQARGVPVAGPMDPVLAPPGERARRQRARRGDARGHAARTRARVRGRAAGRGGRRRLRADARRPRGAAARAVHRRAPGRVCGSARGGRGARAYLAVSGGIAVPPVLGSRATHLISAMGGLDGRALRRRRSAAARATLDPRRRHGARAAERDRRAAGSTPRLVRVLRRAAGRTTSRRTRSTSLQSAPYIVGARIPIAWGSGSRARG